VDITSYACLCRGRGVEDFEVGGGAERTSVLGAELATSGAMNAGVSFPRF
jgi:hypothetical protein